MHRAIFFTLYLFLPVLLFAQPIGDLYQAGTTYYDFQYITGGVRTISVDAGGWIHFVWTNGLNQTTSARHVFYNLWNPETMDFIWEVGTQIDAGNRAGYVTQFTSADGRCYPVYIENSTGSPFSYGAVAIDLLPRSGAFSGIALNGTATHMLWPRVAASPEGDLLHVVAASPTGEEAGDPYALYYLRLVPVFEDGWGVGFEYYHEHDPQLIDTISVPAYDIAVTSNGQFDQVAITWLKSRDFSNRRNNDLVYKKSNNNGSTFWPEVNITDFIPPDFDCLGGDTAVCNRDTFRVHFDISTLWLNNPEPTLHVAFSTSNFYALENRVANYAGQLWHWSEDTQQFAPIRAVGEEYWTNNWAPHQGDYELVLQDPSLTLDPVTGDFYCIYTFSELDQWSDMGYSQADVWACKSIDGGLSWSEGINVTNTDGGQGSHAGECADEAYPSTPTNIHYINGEGHLEIAYLFDSTAGIDDALESSSLCTVHLQSVPIDLIPSTPIRNNQWPVLHADSSGTPPPSASRETIPTPAFITLHQNYPNPFNNSTTVQFDLSRSSAVSLAIYDLTGRLVEELMNRKQLAAGAHSLSFDASSLTSGTYFVRLEARGFSATRKMLLLK